MRFINGIWNDLVGNSESQIKAPSAMEIMQAGACPNCWGTQEYNDKYIAFRKDKTKSNISNQEQKAFVTQFVETYVSGIKLLKEADRTYCPKCNDSINA